MAGPSARRHHAQAPRRSGDDLSPGRHHLRGVWRQGRRRRRHRAADPVRPDSAHHSGRRMGHSGKRPGAAGQRAEPLPARRLSRPGHHQGRHRPGRADPGQRAVPQGDDGRLRAAPDLLAHRRRRHRPGPQRAGRGRVLRAGGQPARSQRRVVHAGRPQDDDAAVPGPVQLAPGGAGGPLSRPAAGNTALVGAAGRARSDRGGADAGHVQQRVLRARLPGAADGHRAGRGPGPVRQGPFRLHAHHPRPEAGRRDLSPRRRRLPGPIGVP